MTYSVAGNDSKDKGMNENGTNENGHRVYRLGERLDGLQVGSIVETETGWHVVRADGRRDVQLWACPADELPAGISYGAASHGGY